jgi:hypothetical protein
MFPTVAAEGAIVRDRRPRLRFGIHDRRHLKFEQSVSI